MPRSAEPPCRAARLMAVCALALAVWTALPAPAHAAAPAAPAAAGGRPAAAVLAAQLAKFYVVRTPQENGGTQETLFDIATRTLGDGNRFEEILVLNSGRLLPDGSVFVSPDQLVPGFALALPEDASGQGVQVGEVPETQAGAGTGAGSGAGSGAGGSAAPAASSAPSASSTSATTPTTGRASNPLAGIGDRVPLPALIGGVAGVAALTVMIVARRPLGRAARAAGSGLARGGRVLRPRLPRGVALALRRRRRAGLARRLAADTRTPVMVRQALREIVPPVEPGTAHESAAGRPLRVYSVLAEPTKLLASVSGADTVPAPWTAVAPTRWERAGLPSVVEGDPDDERMLSLPHLARIGVSEREAQVMVDLGQINGALSVCGDLAVAQDTVAALVRGLLELPRQNTVVVSVDVAANTLPGLNGLVRVRSVADVRGRVPDDVLNTARELGVGLVRGAARTGEVTGFVVLLDPPTADEARTLAELATPEGGGWTVLTVGDVPGAHWRWYAEPDGGVDLGVLGLKVIVPTQALVGAGTGRV
ncbi:hypothetical protein ABZ896_21940 [Streptomyces sp. NPDC047072]|uniref:hypothetical protein n=1 Tax=Streptomyces sp. NPDC047072 TaxID=3154809 RepID=UPI00340573ED